MRWEIKIKVCIEWIVRVVLSVFVLDILLHTASDILGTSAGTHTFNV